MKRIWIASALVVGLALALTITWAAWPVQHLTVHTGGPGIYTARTEIPKGTFVDSVIQRNMVWVTGGYGRHLDPHGISSFSDIEGEVALVDIPKGAQIATWMFASSSHPIIPPPKPSPTRTSGT